MTVEVSEAWRAPATWLLRPLARAGVPLVPASDTADVGLIGHWRYVRGMYDVLEAAGTVPAPRSATPEA